MVYFHVKLRLDVFASTSASLSSSSEELSASLGTMPGGASPPSPRASWPAAAGLALTSSSSASMVGTMARAEPSPSGRTSSSSTKAQKEGTASKQSPSAAAQHAAPARAGLASKSPSSGKTQKARPSVPSSSPSFP